MYFDLSNSRTNGIQLTQNFLSGAVVKAPKFSQSTVILKCSHFLKINERINYKLLSVSHIQSSHYDSTFSYLYKLISVQPSRNTRSLSAVSITRLSPTSFLKIPNRPIRFASPHLWNQLPASFRQSYSNPSHSSHFISLMPVQMMMMMMMFIIITSTVRITPFYFSLQAQNRPFHKSFPPLAAGIEPLDCLRGLLTAFRTFYAHRFVFIIISLSFLARVEN